MKSPFTGGKIILKKERKVRTFRKEQFEIWEHFYVCQDTGEEFTTNEIDALNVSQVYNQYRERHGIPFQEQIVKIRKKYGVSATKMAEILGFGANVYRNYEHGEIPNESNGKLILMAEEPDEFKRLLEYSKGDFSKNEYKKIMSRVEKLIDQEQKHWFENEKRKEVFSPNLFPNQYNGYSLPNLEKIGNLIISFCEGLKAWKTSVNKFLFYADLWHYAKTGKCITGLSYRAIDYGPVPANYDKLYPVLQDKGFLGLHLVKINDDILGEKFYPKSSFTAEIFEDTELEIIQKVMEFFQNKNSKEIVKLSHMEEIWKNNFVVRDMISFKEYDFE